MPATRHLKNLSKVALRKLFEQGQRVGFDILPRHFYSEIPLIRSLKQSDHWRRPYSMQGVGGDINSQLDFVRRCCEPFRDKLREVEIHKQAAALNGVEGFGKVEADFLYAFIRTYKPRQVLQIGCGVATAICLAAAQDAHYQPEIICVEPYPNSYLETQVNERRVRLLQTKAEHLDLAEVDRLESGSLFFVDSTHTLGPSGEVSRIVLEMLPRLKSGSWVHFHDITFPYDYDRHVLDSALFFQHESILLHAFLTYNSRFRIAASLSMLHYSRPDCLSTLLPNYRPAKNRDGLTDGEGDFPSSIYLEVL